jgi:hypothetical protein
LTEDVEHEEFEAALANERRAGRFHERADELFDSDSFGIAE